MYCISRDAKTVNSGDFVSGRIFSNFDRFLYKILIKTNKCDKIPTKKKGHNLKKTHCHTQKNQEIYMAGIFLQVTPSDRIFIYCISVYIARARKPE